MFRSVPVFEGIGISLVVSFRKVRRSSSRSWYHSSSDLRFAEYCAQSSERLQPDLLVSSRWCRRLASKPRSTCFSCRMRSYRTTSCSFGVWWSTWSGTSHHDAVSASRASASIVVSSSVRSWSFFRLLLFDNAPTDSSFFDTGLDLSESVFVCLRSPSWVTDSSILESNGLPSESGETTSEVSASLSDSISVLVCVSSSIPSCFPWPVGAHSSHTGPKSGAIISGLCSLQIEHVSGILISAFGRYSFATFITAWAISFRLDWLPSRRTRLIWGRTLERNSRSHPSAVSIPLAWPANATWRNPSNIAFWELSILSIGGHSWSSANNWFVTNACVLLSPGNRCVRVKSIYWSSRILMTPPANCGYRSYFSQKSAFDVSSDSRICSSSWDNVLVKQRSSSGPESCCWNLSLTAGSTTTVGSVICSPLIDFPSGTARDGEPNFTGTLPLWYTFVIDSSVSRSGLLTCMNVD